MAAISSWKRGDYTTVARATIKDSTKVTLDNPEGLVDLTDGYTITWQLRRTPNAGSFVAVDMDMSEADSGVLYGTLEKTVTSEMTPGEWVSDIEITDVEGKPFSSRTFTVEVLPDVSRAVTVTP